MTANKAAIDEWLHDPQRTKPEPFTWQHGEVLGRSAPPRANDLSQVTDASQSVVVLLKDPTAPGGFFIYTSYPAP